MFFFTSAQPERFKYLYYNNYLAKMDIYKLYPFQKTSYVKIENFGAELKAFEKIILCNFEGKYSAFGAISHLITSIPDT